ncbi:anthranilate 1,2-dioxygenase [Tardibacter chloracetimidivorans]|uniref:Anthranilate 1,2-dioxygenase n=1 Tax=Tardibacter chloracetimidivorans TaxID=1921510 RepID=A0A1L3ZVW3_9SPHN|nr:aromatic-ring-hydroxylating dioxygenase subunit beta [Tardibacter chloracetimidivorans]API59767.1 anthranilate 1,2-dioxygenase [Tardibacter chloracetimidivorans]
MEKFLLQLELQDLQTRYISAIDDGRFEEWPDFFTPDATYEILPRENVDQGLPAGVMLCFSQAMMRDRVVSMREANVYHAHTYRHFVSAFEILDQTGDQVTTRSNYLIMRAMNELNADIFQVGRYEDVVVRTDGGWRYKSKRAIFENARVDTLLVIPV